MANILKPEDFPTGPKPGWELEEPEPVEEEDVGPLNSVAESFVLVNSLKRSRATWLASTFPKFSSKTRGGKAAPEAVPPAHSTRNLGKCDIEIGPHIFTDTSVYEALYLPPAIPRPPNPPVAQATWQAATSYGSTAFMPYSQYAIPVPPSPAPAPPPATPTPPHVTQRASTPLVSSVASDIPMDMTPALYARVNEAAAADPILSNFLQLAATARASPDQLKTLQLLIQSLAATAPESTPLSTTPAPTAAPPATSKPTTASNEPAQRQATTTSAAPVAAPAYPYPAYTYAIPAQYQPVPTIYSPKEHDIILEFKERPNDRWLLPRSPVILERTPAEGIVQEIHLSVVLPFSKPEPAVTTSSNESSMSGQVAPLVESLPQEVVTFRLTKMYPVMWEGLLRWAGSPEKLEANKAILRNIKTPERVYLQHQVREGELLTKLQNAAAPPYTMKSIKPAYGGGVRPKRRAATRKTADAKATDANPTPKRRKISQTKTIAPAKKIACVSCGQTDVPLLMGGRFCRPCVETGKSAAPILAVGSSGVTPSTPMTPASGSQTPSTPNALLHPAGSIPSVLDRRVSSLAAPPLTSPSPLATTHSVSSKTQNTPSEPPGGS